MTLILNLQSLQHENGTLLMTKIMDNMAEEMKMIQPLNLKQKSLNQIFVITQMHIFLRQEIKIADIAADTNVAFNNCTPFCKMCNI